MARKVEILDDRGQARQRLAIWAGSDMPHTIVTKELIDNELDVVSERKQPATKAIIEIGPNRIKLIDNGAGISTHIHEESGKTHLWLACAKMFTSSNYSGIQDSVGANGVGLTTANYTACRSAIVNFNGRSVKGYAFTDGYLNGTPESGISESGDLVENPLSYEEAYARFKPAYEHGFLTDITWDKVPNDVFQDGINIDWLINYARIRTAEINSGQITIRRYSDDEFTTLVKEYKWSKDEIAKSSVDENGNYIPDSEGFLYLPSWEEQVKAKNGTVLKDGPWHIAFFEDENVKIPPIVQGAPIKERFVVNQSIDIQDYSVRLSIPYTLKYLSTDYPPYTDQTKTDIRIPYSAIARAFERSGDVYQHFYKLAEKAYMAKVIKDSDARMFWPSLGPSEESELIIAEGFSAINGVKAQRDPNTQACIALRGKISNVWNMDMVKAMNSDIVKQILNVVLHNNYQRVIIATDADEAGYHISALLLALFHRFTNLISDEKLYYLHTPHYIFKKGKEIAWSDDANDCPAGWHTTTCKGLGSLTAAQTELFITNPETRTLQKIVSRDEKADWKELDDAFSYGGEKYIIE